MSARDARAVRFASWVCVAVFAMIAAQFFRAAFTVEILRAARAFCGFLFVLAALAAHDSTRV